MVLVFSVAPSDTMCRDVVSLVSMSDSHSMQTMNKHCRKNSCRRRARITALRTKKARIIALPN